VPLQSFLPSLLGLTASWVQFPFPLLIHLILPHEWQSPQESQNWPADLQPSTADARLVTGPFRPNQMMIHQGRSIAFEFQHSHKIVGRVLRQAGETHGYFAL